MDYTYTRKGQLVLAFSIIAGPVWSGTRTWPLTLDVQDLRVEGFQTSAIYQDP
jgi:hypothetical protein